MEFRKPKKFTKDNLILDCDDRNADEDRLPCNVIRRDEDGKQTNEGFVEFEKTGENSFRTATHSGFTEGELEQIEGVFKERWIRKGKGLL